MQNTRSQNAITEVKAKIKTLKQEHSLIKKSEESVAGVEEAYSPTLTCYGHFSASTSYFPLNSTSQGHNAVGENFDADFQNPKDQKMEFGQEAAEALYSFPSQKSKNQVDTLAQILIEELEDVSANIFFDAKWKIIDVLREAQNRHRHCKMKEMQNKVMLSPGKFRTTSSSSSSSSSVIIVQSPNKFPIFPKFKSSTPQRKAKSSAPLSLALSETPTCQNSRVPRNSKFRDFPSVSTSKVNTAVPKRRGI